MGEVLEVPGERPRKRSVPGSLSESLFELFLVPFAAACLTSRPGSNLGVPTKSNHYVALPL